MVHILSVGKEANLPLLSCQTCCGTCCSCVDSGWSFCLSAWHSLGPPPPGPLWPGLPLRMLLHLLQHCCCCSTGNPKRCCCTCCNIVVVAPLGTQKWCKFFLLLSMLVKLPMSMNLRIFSLHWILAKVLLGPLCKLYYEMLKFWFFVGFNWHSSFPLASLKCSSWPQWC